MTFFPGHLLLQHYFLRSHSCNIYSSAIFFRTIFQAVINSCKLFILCRFFPCQTLTISLSSALVFLAFIPASFSLLFYIPAAPPLRASSAECIEGARHTFSRTPQPLCPSSLSGIRSLHHDSPSHTLPSLHLLYVPKVSIHITQYK